MKVLVTGTAGFIGFHLANRLLAEGHSVVGLDNFNDYYTILLKKDRHSVLEGQLNYTGNWGDLCDRKLVARIFSEHEFDCVVHLAAQAGVRYSLKNPFCYIHSNIEGFLTILEACRHAKTPRLVYASSSSVYGANTKVPFSEEDRVDHPVSLYGATKRADELFAHSYTHLFGLQTVGLRFFTVYGPWGRPDMAMWLFTERILDGRPIDVYNQGNMRRDFTYVNDIVNGIVGAMTADGLEPYEIFNLGNHRSENLMDMIHVLEEALGRKAEIRLQPMQPGDVEATFADVERARAKLGFEPSTPITVGIPAFVKWFREYNEK